jgi:hypothetical protein
MTLVSGCALALWTGGTFLDLGDGQTWAKTRQRYVFLLEAEGFEVNNLGFYRVMAKSHPKEFREILMFRGVLPTVFLAILFGVSALGWAVQPREATNAPRP